MRLPDELGPRSDSTIIAALGLGNVKVKSLRIDYNDNEVNVEIYVTDSLGHPIQKADGEPVTTFLEFPVHA